MSSLVDSQRCWPRALLKGLKKPLSHDPGPQPPPHLPLALGVFLALGLIGCQGMMTRTSVGPAAVEPMEPVMAETQRGDARLRRSRTGQDAMAEAAQQPDPDLPAPDAAIQIETGSITSVSGCIIDYRRYQPGRPRVEGMVILGHGFLRSQEHMAGMARALAAAGLVAVTLDFCQARPWEGGHYGNGLDMVRLARQLGAGRVVYVGFSAGALAALIAGRQDPGALGIITLDLVDDHGLGLRLVEGLGKPLVGLMGEPSRCNAQANGLPILVASRLGHTERIPGAGHCDFETPSDWLCELLCGPSGQVPGINRVIIQATLRAALNLLGSRPPGPVSRVSL